MRILFKIFLSFLLLCIGAIGNELCKFSGNPGLGFIIQAGSLFAIGAVIRYKPKKNNLELNKEIQSVKDE